MCKGLIIIKFSVVIVFIICSEYLLCCFLFKGKINRILSYILIILLFFVYIIFKSYKYDMILIIFCCIDFIV